jgi:hypothetical protein
MQLVPRILFAAPLIVASLTFSAAANPDYVNNDWDHAYRRATSTPAPIAGLALIALGPTAGFLYWFFRRYRRDHEGGGGA